MSQYEYRGSVYPPRRAMCQARRAHYVELLNQGMNFTQAARMVGVSKRTGKLGARGEPEALTGTNGPGSTGIVMTWTSPTAMTPRACSTPVSPRCVTCPSSCATP